MKRFALIAALLPWGIVAADCKFERRVDQELDVAGSELLAVSAGAGDLYIQGEAGSRTVRIGGRACASRQEWIEEARVEAREGREATIDVQLPDAGRDWSIFGSTYVYLDLELMVPDDLALSVRDSSGDIQIENVHALDLQDSSGDIGIAGAAGPVNLRDSSGDIEIVDLEKDLVIEADSSGDIRGRDIRGDVRVVRDSSGNIRFSDVGGDVVVERDSSGDIVANGVGGDFRVERDGSGDVRTSDVAGTVSLPRR